MAWIVIIDISTSAIRTVESVMRTASGYGYATMCTWRSTTESGLSSVWTES